VTNTAHAVRIFIYWLIASVIAEILLITAIPTPGPTLSEAGAGEHTTMRLFFFTGAPIFVFICVYMVYAVIMFRDRSEPETLTRTEPAKTNVPALLIWCGITFSTVVFLAAWGTFTLNEVTEAAGPHPLVVQVIAQQWHFTYRYPSYGGFETYDLAVPVNTPITFSITSLDVVHDFWIYNEDVKQDAVPGTTTTVYMDAKTVGSQWVVCDELCGIWHGHMRGPMAVLSAKNFQTWVKQQQASHAPVQKYMPPQSDTYFPDPQGFPSAPQNSSQ